MEIRMTRGEIRSEMQALAGMQGGSLNQHNNPQLNAFIDTSYRHWLAKCVWVSNHRVDRPILGVDQTEIPLPSDSFFGAVYCVGYWDPDLKRHINLERKTFTPEQDVEPLNVEGGPDDWGQRDCPQYWQQSGGVIKIAPQADQQYQMMVQYSVSTRIAGDNDIVIIDGELVKLGAMSHMMLNEGDNDMARAYNAQAVERYEDLRSHQSSGEAISLGGPNGAVDDGPQHFVNLPNWDRSPSVKPTP